MMGILVLLTWSTGCSQNFISFPDQGVVCSDFSLNSGGKVELKFTNVSKEVIRFSNFRKMAIPDLTRAEFPADMEQTPAAPYNSFYLTLTWDDNKAFLVYSEVLIDEIGKSHKRKNFHEKASSKNSEVVVIFPGETISRRYDCHNSLVNIPMGICLFSDIFYPGDTHTVQARISIIVIREESKSIMEAETSFDASLKDMETFTIR